MVYQSLYRKFRPRGFAQGFVGQQHIVKALQNSLAANRLAHAYLFAGPRGTGKTTTAKIFAKAANCLSADKPVPEPCNQCELCLQVNSGNAMDVIEMDAATNRGIEEVRDLRERVQYAPVLGRYKIYIIDEVHMLTTEAFNALLKTLEEPPAHVIFILATTEPQRLPATILSRCQRYDFRPLSEEMIAGHLQEVAKQSGVNLDSESARLLAFRAQGGMRDALGMLEQVMAYAGADINRDQVWQVLGSADRASLAQLAEALHARDIGRALHVLEDFGKAGIDFRQLLADMLELLREQLLAVLGAKKGSEAPLSLQSPAEIMTLMETFSSALLDSRRWASPRLAAEIMVIKHCNQQAAPGEPMPEAVPSSAQRDRLVKVDDGKWQEVLDLVKKESITSYAWLKESKAWIEGEKLVIRYPANYNLHCDNIMKPEHKQIIVPVIRQTLGLSQYEASLEK